MKKIAILFPSLILASNIQTIEFKDLIHLSPLTAKSLITIRENEEYDIKKVDESLKKLFETGYFQNIIVEKNKNKLIFNCIEKPIIYKIEFHNLSEELRKTLKEQNLIPKKGEIFKKERIKTLQEFIKSYYLSKSYFNTIVYVKKQIKNNKVYLDITINKGQELIITNVNFYGNKSISKSDLIDEIYNQPRDCFSIFPFVNSGTLNIYKLLSDQQTLQEYYLNLGFMDAKVQTPLAITDFDNFSATVDFHIKEGNRYIVKSVNISYPKNIKVNLPQLELKVDKYFNISALREDLKNIKHAFQNEGYAYAQVYPKIEKKGNLAYITYEVIPNNIVYINNVIIQGNTKTLDRVIRRNIFLAPKDKFSYKNLIDSKNALQRSGYLEDVKIEQKKVSYNKIDLIVKVKEGLSGSLRAGISYGSYTKLGFNLALTERNVFGSGQSLTINANYSNVSSTYSINLKNPRVFDSLYSLNTSIFKSRFEGISYTEKKNGFKIGIGKEILRNTNLDFSYGYTKTHLYNYDTTEYIKPTSTKSYIVTSLSFNNTDNFFFPTTGTIAQSAIEFSGIGGDEKYIKVSAAYKYFYPIKNKTYKTVFVLKYKALGGVIKKTGYLPINEKFYLGGMGSVRGFGYYSISPKDSQGTLIGGKYEFITGPEISTPISLKNRLWLSGFIDYGVVGENSLNISRSSYGIAVNWVTPMGPLSFIWAWPIKSKPTDDLQKFEFNIGTSF